MMVENQHYNQPLQIMKVGGLHLLPSMTPIVQHSHLTMMTEMMKLFRRRIQRKTMATICLSVKMGKVTRMSILMELVMLTWWALSSLIHTSMYIATYPKARTLKPVENCTSCGAKKFMHETKGFCCQNGKISLSMPDTPGELMRLWTCADDDARHFRDNIRFFNGFNGHFSFTSLYCHLDSTTTDMSTNGIYTFQAHAQMYRNIL